MGIEYGFNDEVQGSKRAYSFTATRDGTLVSSEVVNLFSKEDLLTYGSVDAIVDLLIAKDVEAWRTLPEKLRTFLKHTTEWQYRVNEKTDIINLIINDMEIRWNGSDWVVEAFHPDTK